MRDLRSRVEALETRHASRATTFLRVTYYEGAPEEELRRLEAEARREYLAMYGGVEPAAGYGYCHNVIVTPAWRKEGASHA